jgi:hypothetical protein
MNDTEGLIASPSDVDTYRSLGGVDQPWLRRLTQGSNSLA